MTDAHKNHDENDNDEYETLKTYEFRLGIIHPSADPSPDEITRAL